MKPNLDFKIALMRRWPTQYDAAAVLDICQPVLSLLVRGHRKPSGIEWVKLRRHFSESQLKHYFGKPPMMKAEEELTN